LISIVIVKHDKIIVLVDLNIHVNDCSDHRAIEFIDLATGLDITQRVCEATNNHRNIWDLIFTREITAN
jgi:hypothetical protein